MQRGQKLIRNFSRELFYFRRESNYELRLIVYIAKLDSETSEAQTNLLFQVMAEQTRFLWTTFFLSVDSCWYQVRVVKLILNVANVSRIAKYFGRQSRFHLKAGAADNGAKRTMPYLKWNTLKKQ